MKRKRRETARNGRVEEKWGREGKEERRATDAAMEEEKGERKRKRAIRYMQRSIWEPASSSNRIRGPQKKQEYKKSCSQSHEGRKRDGRKEEGQGGTRGDSDDRGEVKGEMKSHRTLANSQASAGIASC